VSRRIRFLPILLALAAVGCRNQADGGEELSYIRTPGDDYLPAVRSENLLPLRAGARWTLEVRAEKGMLPDEEQRVTRADAGGGTIETLQNGKVTQTETYRVSPKGIEIVATGVGVAQTLNPPLPLVRYPIEEEKIYSWQGTAGRGAKTFIGQAWSRATRRETVSTPAGNFSAWRVETRTLLTLGDRQELVYITRWMVPGIGIVRQKVVTPGGTVMKKLKKLPDIETTGVK
jgi:hypothetical protein